MSQELKIAWKLYAMHYNDVSREIAVSERFSRISDGYVLLYTDKAAPEHSVEIGESAVWRLSETERQWLQDCNLIILAEETKRHEAQIAADLGKRVAMLEEALKAEKQKQGD